jgi:hypothetical protein
MFTIFPLRRSIIVGRTCLIDRNVPRRLACIVWSKSSTAMFCNGVSIGPVTPATLTRMSICRSNASRAFSTIAFTWASMVTSQA